MILKVPQSSECQRVLIEVTGEDVLRRIEASTDIPEVVPSLPEGISEAELMVTAQFLNEAHEPMGDVIVLQEPENVWTEDLPEDLEEVEEPEEVDGEEESVDDLEEDPDDLDAEEVDDQVM